jgi:uncharacterized protein (TIGR03437 family)
MRAFRRVLAGALTLWGLASADTPAAPAIVPGGIVNSASRLPASLRGGAIAQGARFLIPGMRLGPATPVRGSESSPPDKLADVSVRIAQGDRAVDAGLLLVSGTNIDAWMPETAPLGEVELTVTYQGRSSEPYKLTVVASSAGLYPAGTTPDLLPEARRSPEGAPGDIVNLWGTGMTGSAVDIVVGGKPAEDVHVTAAACCKGVEQVALRVPADTPQGCFVPVQALTGGRPSNAISIAVHPRGEPCKDELDWFHAGVKRAGYVVLARVFFDMRLAPNADSRFQFDYGIASFGQQETGQRQFPPLPPAGTCTVFTARLRLREILGQVRSSAWTSIPERTPGNSRLDAGEAISMNGPAGVRKLQHDPRQQEYYDATLGGVGPFSREPAKPLYLSRGAYTISAPGGKDIGPFSVKVEVTPSVTWKNRERTDTIDRDAGVTLEWKAVRSGDEILILAMNADRGSGDTAAGVCVAHAADGRFRIPPAALGNLPPTRPQDDLTASLVLLAELPVNPPARIEANGLDAGFAAFLSVDARLVKYK